MAVTAETVSNGSEVWFDGYTVDEMLVLAERYLEKWQAESQGDPGGALLTLTRVLMGVEREDFVATCRDPYLRCGIISLVDYLALSIIHADEGATSLPEKPFVYDSALPLGELYTHLPLEAQLGEGRRWPDIFYCAGELCLRARLSDQPQTGTHYGITLVALPDSKPSDLHRQYQWWQITRSS